MKVPHWGQVVAQPHEYLIQIRNGRVRRHGQGASCFKWPGDSVALVSTSIAKLSFSADQVTREKVGVEVTGLAVYRVVEPMLAYRMIDGDLTRLTDILREMFVGATRRIVAGLALEDCITHRKERVASALVEEIAPVLAGQGAMGDTTSQGWGVVLDTIEIQNVRVLSEEVFARLQAPYRESLALEALKAREQVEEEQARITVARQRAEEQAKRTMMAEEEARLEAERQRDVERARHEEALAKAALSADIERALERERAEQERKKNALAAELERRSKQSEAELAQAKRQSEAELERRARVHLAELEQAKQQIELERERALAELATRREQAELEAETVRASRAARADLSDRQLEELMLSETLPRMADAFRGSFGEIHLTAASGQSSELFTFLSSGIEQVARATRRVKSEVAPGAAD
jgi:flotillin